LGALALAALAAAALLALQRRDDTAARPTGRASPHFVLAPGDRRPQPDEPLADVLEGKGLSLPVDGLSILVDKSRYELHLLSAQTLLKTYPISLGFAPRGDKARRDDGRTPEGELYVCQKAAQEGEDVWSEYFIRLSYPHAAAAERGLAAGVISEDQHREILAALGERRIPPQDTALGSGIAIHVGGISSLTWTEGCIALRREDGRELYAHIPLRTPVIIRP
jgi:hypothetical protein